jgi:hypothetical protein
VGKSGEQLSSSGNKKEKWMRIGRNINALGAVAMAGLAIAVPAGAIAFNTLAAVNAAQAGGFEVLRRRMSKKKAK